MTALRAVLFDVFGTLVDWRSGISAAFAEAGAACGVTADFAAMADAWRGRYRPSLDAVRAGARPFTDLDTLHRESLLALLPSFGAGAMAEEMDTLVAAWHRLPPWPDAAPGLARIRQTAWVAPLSNGHLALQIDLARHAGFAWDAVFGADVLRHYKPDREVYLGACKLLGLAPGEVMLAAAHNEDLAAARALGLRTGFISRPLEYGAPDARARPAEAWDIVAGSVEALAGQLSGAF
ncbi:MAG: haloacid dehalogenase, type II [Rhodospirillales bacterium 20-64-7]|nr:MAG: haloacid dehalogenase, type II [Rhodospirillales bacterium 20-64-7]